MKSTYEIKQEMEKKFGKDFMNKMEREKEEFARLQKELVKAKSFEEKVNDKNQKTRETFVYIHDDFNFYPHEVCNQHMYSFSRECVELELSKEAEFELYISKQIECLDAIEDGAKRILIQVEELRKQVKEEEVVKF